MSFLDKVKGNIRDTVTVAQEGVEELQARHDLGLAYRDLGRRTADLVDAGSMVLPGLELELEAVRRLRQQIGDEDSVSEAGVPAAI